MFQEVLNGMPDPQDFQRALIQASLLAPPIPNLPYAPYLPPANLGDVLGWHDMSSQAPYDYHNGASSIPSQPVEPPAVQTTPDKSTSQVTEGGNPSNEHSGTQEPVRFPQPTRNRGKSVQSPLPPEDTDSITVSHSKSGTSRRGGKLNNEDDEGRGRRRHSFTEH
jgi:hypothetical protein